MGRFRESKDFEQVPMEEEMVRWWEAEGIFRKSIESRQGRKRFTFYEGPPTANGRPGIHHVLARTIKDIFCRYRTMRGYLVQRKAGWDTHGLPVEIEVEKELGLESRSQVEEYGIEPYNRACRESVLRYKDSWERMTARIGYWVDMTAPYVTFSTDYMESVWWLIKQIHEKGLLYKGHRIQWYSPGTGTVLSSHEVSLGYKEIQDASVYVRFPLRDELGTSFLAWTTTPWTLISNAALAVGPEIDYVRVRVETPLGESEQLILAEALLDVLKLDYEKVETCRGRELVGKHYAPPFDFFAPDNAGDGRIWRVVPADYVSTEEGTGIVHTAPAFGADDFQSGIDHGLPVLNPVARDGRFTDKIPFLEGVWFKEADKPIVRDLRERGLLFRQETYLHNYPHDWRKGTPLMSYPVEGWFIRTTALKDRLVELNRQIHWHPKAIGSGRFGQWLENNIDWALNRSRYWGTPLPVWQSDAPDSEHFEVIGSIEELRAKCGDQLPPDSEIDLHRPYLDRLTWPAPDGGTMRRVPDVIDAWFDSGSMPFAQWHYPFENREAFEKSFPADFIAEGLDQTRGWFYTLHAIATLVTDGYSFKNVIVNGLLLDEKGEKMSKSRGNVVDPDTVLDRYGADAVRWYMMANSPPWENLKWSEKGLKETARRFFGTLGNVYNFFSTYANIDGFRDEEERIPLPGREELDRWIISRLNSTIQDVTEALDGYHPTRAARALEQFVDELSNWYLRRSRRRFWREKGGAGKMSAYQTVYECLLTLAKLISPIAPFYPEWLFQSLQEGVGRHEALSIHLTDFPEADEECLDPDLERRMRLARTIASTVLSLRAASRINVRQPLSRILVVTGPGTAGERDLDGVRDVILDEVNVHRMEYVQSSSGLVVRTAKPNFKTLGRRLGATMKAAAAAVKAMDDEQIEEYESSGRVELEVEGRTIEFGPDDIEVDSQGIEGWLVEKNEGITVAIDLQLTDELIEEGLARELVNRVQNQRKTARYDVTDRIKIELSASEGLSKAFRTHEAHIRTETLAVEVSFTASPQGELVERYEIGAEEATIGLTRA